ncbi:MAG: amidase [Burkholderiales bacterium]
MDRRDLLRLAAAGTALAANLRNADAQAMPSSEIAQADVATLGALQKSGAQSAVSIAQMYLARMDAIDRAGPSINAVIERNPDALAIAEQLDRERKEKGPRGPLHGIPVLLKDNIDTADRMRTTAGSLALAEHTAARDAFLVERLRAAGCVVLGKTNLSEWANFRSTRSTSAWSGRGGQTRNPYALDRNTSGSSSGSGAAMAADLCAIAVGTETDGSITSPASVCGLVGIKPTVGLVSRSGIIPISHSQDTAGPMTRTVADAAALLTAMAGVDPRDAATRASKGKAQDYTKALDPAGLKGARIGIARDLFGPNGRVDRVVEEGIAAMKDAGAIVVDPVKLTSHGKLGANEDIVLLYEFKAGLDAYLAGTGPSVSVRSLADVVAFNARNAEREMPYFGQEIMLQSLQKGPLTEPEYQKALAMNHLLSRDKGIDAALAANKLDALVAPSAPLAWIIDYANGDNYRGGAVSQMPAVAGYPHITVPAGFAFGLPVGVSFFAGAYSESKLIKLAFAFEQATKARRAPKFEPTLSMRG